MTTTDVLVVGAGPTGLMLAVWLARAGIKPLVIDRKETTSRETRALGVQARTLETYDMLGLGALALEKGIRARGVTMWVHRRAIAHADFDDIGHGISPHPYLFIMGQDETEKLLLEELLSLGGTVRWQTTLETLSQNDRHVTATLRAADGTVETVEARYAGGCDGASSSVRHALGVGFPGGTYGQRFFVADVSAEGPLSAGDVGLCLGETGFVAFFPMQGAQHYRIVGIVPPSLVHKEDLSLEDGRADAERRSGMTVTGTTWFSTYNVHHRVAEHFRRGRVFLLGDAGHIHSPVGAPGMNTGLMDATNLGWKLAAVLNGAADARILDTYAGERIPFAKQLVETTDRIFSLVSSPDPWTGPLRAVVAPAFFGLMTHLPFVRRELYGLISQTRIAYHDSALSKGAAGGVRGGDRLPWVRYANGSSNFDVLTQLRPHLQVYGPVPNELESFATVNRGIPLVKLPEAPQVRHAGLQAGAAYFVRPDGYVAYASSHFDGTDFLAYLKSAWGCTPDSLAASATARTSPQ
ncbi:MAG TPA: FAD-dependent oxidoreductase [Oscillatoriaceae cyanobacterium]